MVSQCANPKCRAEFLYLNSGKLFAQFHDSTHSSHVEFFWLCGNCENDPNFLSFLPLGARMVPQFFARHAREAEKTRGRLQILPSHPAGTNPKTVPTHM
jgi:hypothetical protein